MRLPIEYYREDQAAKKEKVQRTLDAEAAIGANEYAPSMGSAEGGQSAFTNRTVSDNPLA